VNDYVALTLDLAGTFVFALTGALVAVRNRLDIFGTLVLACATGLGGGALAAIGHHYGWPTVLVLAPGMAVCFGWRVASMQLGWAPPPARGL
jgi:uncharacterized membrane protein YeiH